MRVPTLVPNFLHVFTEGGVVSGKLRHGPTRPEIKKKNDDSIFSQSHHLICAYQYVRCSRGRLRITFYSHYCRYYLWGLEMHRCCALCNRQLMGSFTRDFACNPILYLIGALGILNIPILLD